MNVLEKIVVDKRVEVEQRKVDFPLTEFIEKLTPNDRDFKQALLNDHKNKGAAFILECKKASPSKGLIRPIFDLDEICQAYNQYASCVSVLTDEKYFQGEFERLPLVKQKLKQPVLCKDFFIDEYQVYLARYYGANAILLMLSVLDDAQYTVLNLLAQQLNMSLLTEVSNNDEMQRAVKLKADILGINNRNLRDLSTDLNKTPELVNTFKSLASEEQISNTVLISESGIYNHQQVNLLKQDVQGFLVGSSLMAQKDLSRACHDLIIGEHKVCCLTEPSAVSALISNTVKHAGLIFVKKSPRYVSIESAKDIIEQDSNGQLKFVAVTQDMPIKYIEKLIGELNISVLQLHGDEDDSYIDAVREVSKNADKDISIWKAVSVEAEGANSKTAQGANSKTAEGSLSVKAAEGSLPKRWPSADRILLDTKNVATGQSGGTGKTFNWDVLKEISLNSPDIMLAGGLSLENITSTQGLPVCGVDVNSGVETSPGKKSEQQIDQLFSLVNKKELH
jgi:indole-3-glycerol phosphate synthase/phosphoribosylanthranilate isomerase